MERYRKAWLVTRCGTLVRDVESLVFFRLSIMFGMIAFVSIIRGWGRGSDGAQRGVRAVGGVGVGVVVSGVDVVGLGVTRLRVVRRVVGGVVRGVMRGGVVRRGRVMLMRSGTTAAATAVVMVVVVMVPAAAAAAAASRVIAVTMIPSAHPRVARHVHGRLEVAVPGRGGEYGLK